MKVAIIGRPNVGKSTLFNRLARQKLAIVGAVPGITRDRKNITADLYGIHFELFDTPGVDPFSCNALALLMNGQSAAAMRESDVVFLVIDAIDDITEYDRAVAGWVRSILKKIGNRKIILIKNKSEGKRAVVGNPTSLGFGEGIYVSAEHNLGFDEIYAALAREEKIPGKECEEQSACAAAATITPTMDNRLKIAIIGRPNVGKSSLINAIIGEERLLTGEQAGITRDAIGLHWHFKNQMIYLIDTAGQRKKSKINDALESIAVLDAWRYVKQANIVVVLMDINAPLEKQDVTMATRVFDEGKIIIFALNKSDTVHNPDEILQLVQKRIPKEFAQVPDAPCLLVSAKEKKGLARIFNVSLDLYGAWNKRISTGVLNRWLQTAIAKNPPPLAGGMPIRLKYVSQTNCKPPTFTIFANRVEHLPKSYERYLLNHLRNSLNFKGIPMRLFVRQRKNPHAE
ncbi:MAG: ribosome biogenesis GTPase Der [Holosporaceae bacterium]|jgi:GTP-binding protein|nr:ribosome biogenesis GTPase Der [Holosporaceae bacterium]